MDPAGEIKHQGNPPAPADSDYEQDAFEEAEASDDYASAADDFSFEEEEVESAPDATLPAPGLAAWTLRAEQEVRQPALSSSSSFSSSSSSLPSLLPSIMSMSSSLTPAGRAHFAQQPSLFARKQMPAAAPAQTSTEASAAAAPTAAARRAYGTSNLLQASESLGIHALGVAAPDSESGDPAAVAAAAAAAPTSLLLDSGRLRLWTGSTATDLQQQLAPSGNGAGTAVADSDAAAFGLLSSVFMRAALVSEGGSQADAEAGGRFLHVPITDGSDPLSSPSGSSSGCVTDEGGPDAELHPCFHVKRLGPYRLRVVSRATSMPPAPDSFAAFMARAQSDSTAAPEGSPASPLPSPFDVQPRVTLYVAVEKLLAPQSDSDSGSGAADTAKGVAAAPSLAPRVVLPLLPVGCPHTFWLSTHQAADGSGGEGSSGAGPAASLVFGDADPAEQLELSLQLQPLHAKILDELNVRDVAAEAHAALEQRATHAPATRRSKKQKKSAAKKRSKGREGREDAVSAASASPPPPPVLVSVTITAPVASSAADATSAEHLVTVAITPARAAATAEPPPSLIDLLATLSVSPAQSLPSSILDPQQRTLTQLAQLTANIANTVAAQAQAPAHPTAPHSNASLPSLGGPWPSAAAAAAAAPSAVSVQLQSLERRCAWPFSVSLDAMRVGAEAEGHVCVDHALDLLHNRPLPPRGASAHSVLVGDHEVELLRTVGLLCAWEAPRDGSALNRPVLVSQQPHISYHVQLRITRLDADEANERAMDAMLDF